MKRGNANTKASLIEARALKEDKLEKKLDEYDSEMKFQNIEYVHFEYLIKKYGFKGICKEKQFAASNLNKKFLRTQDLNNYTTRISAYFNSELVMVEDQTKFSKQNEQVLKTKHITLTYRSLEVLIIGFLFCKHRNSEEMADSFWGLINPAQTE